MSCPSLAFIQELDVNVLPRLAHLGVHECMQIRLMREQNGLLGVDYHSEKHHRIRYHANLSIAFAGKAPTTRPPSASHQAEGAGSFMWVRKISLPKVRRTLLLSSSHKFPRSDSIVFSILRL